MKQLRLLPTLPVVILILTFTISCSQIQGLFTGSDGPVTVFTQMAGPVRRNRLYSQRIQATGGSGRYEYRLSSGSLPPGLSLQQETGEISGIPDGEPGTWSFSIVVSDYYDGSNGTEASLQIEVIPLLWRIMVYMAADNSLSSYAVADINEIEQVRLAGSGVEVLILADFAGAGDTKLYRAGFDGSGSNEIVSEEIPLADVKNGWSGVNEANTGDPAVLHAFLGYAEEAYPAENTMLIIWNHGTGWRSLSRSVQGSQVGISLSDVSRSVCIDESSADDLLHTAELGEALRDSSLTVIGNDLCYGAMLEVMFELSPHARYYIGSEDIEAAEGWDYKAFLSAFLASRRTPADLIDSVIDSYADTYATNRNAVLSAVDLAAVPGVLTALDALSDELVTACSTSEVQNQLRNLLTTEVESFFEASRRDLNIDLSHFSDVIESRTDYADEAARSLKEAVSAAVMRNWKNSASASENPYAAGIALHLTPLDSAGNPASHDPAYFSGYSGDYPIRFVSASSWAPDNTTGTGFLYRLWYQTF